MTDETFDRTVEYVGRLLRNGFGKKEIVSLPPKYWNYFDWCVDQGWDMDDWTMYYDLDRAPDSTFSEKIYFEFWRFLCSRYKQGLPCPPNSPPDGYEDFIQELEDGKYTEIFPNYSEQNDKDEKMSHSLITASGDVEIVTLSRKYWLHFEWLYTQGVNMKAWVEKIDLKRNNNKGLTSSFADNIELALVQSEERNYLNGVDMPLYIHPEGYSK